MIEGKVDNISQKQQQQQTTTAATTATTTATATPSPYEAPAAPPPSAKRRPINQQAGSSGDSVPTSASLQQSGVASPVQLYRYASAVHQMMAWPVVRQLLDPFSPRGSELHGFFMDPDPPAAMLAQQAARQRPLPTTGFESLNMTDRVSLGLPNTGGSFGLTDLNWTTMENLAKTYFDTFNLIYPIMDRQTFSSDLMASVINDGFDAGVNSTLVCLVLALGSIAMADAQNIPFAGYKNPDDDKADFEHRPPGLAFFNEARKRLGFSLTDVSLENVQVFALAGYALFPQPSSRLGLALTILLVCRLYFASCSRHMVSSGIPTTITLRPHRQRA